MLENKKILLATSNKGKITEFKKIFNNFEIFPQGEFNIEEPVEDGLSFLENALIKARHGSIKSGMFSVADDSGIVVPGLDFAPGIYSARYAGENATDLDNRNKIIDELKNLKVNLKLITDGDVLGALYVTNPKYNVDIFLGIGGGPEGVLAASALDAFDCHFQCRFIFDNDKDIKDANKMGITDLNKKYELNEIIKGDSIFCSTGITSSEMLNGVVINNNEYITETLVTHKSLKFKETIKRTNLIEE